MNVSSLKCGCALLCAFEHISKIYCPFLNLFSYEKTIFRAHIELVSFFAFGG